MADKTIGELKEAPIDKLPPITDLYDDTLIPVQQQGESRKMTGAQWKGYAQASVSQYIDEAQGKVDEASALVSQAAGFAKNAQGYADNAQTSADTAAKHQQGAEAARQAIEDMTVSADTLAPGSAATATKSAAGGTFNIRFGIPQGKQGEVGPQGPQGKQGPEGPQGINGVVTEVEGHYSFDVNDEGHLILHYMGDEAPDFSINEGNGHLYLNIA